MVVHDNITTLFDIFINTICDDRTKQDLPCKRSPHGSSIPGSQVPQPTWKLPEASGLENLTISRIAPLQCIAMHCNALGE